MPISMQQTLQRVAQLQATLKGMRAKETASEAPISTAAPTQDFANVLESAQTLSPAERSLAPTGQVKQWIEALGQKHGVDAKLLESVVATESGFNPDAISSSGAQGLMQLMPSTAQSLGVKDALDPLQNLDGGTRYLKELLTKYQSVPKALAAYNAGPGAVDRAGGIPPYAETQHYVDKVMTRYQKAL
ncbi:MAG: lytic transglycosylase domain-containing protein [Vampirovibrionales bacterium]|nr:lytic transglycosylase domain-containing protein [Vampirovibrionales bacterium]